MTDEHKLNLIKGKHSIRDLLDLEASRQLFMDIIEFLPDATFVIDKERKVIAWNRALEKMTGVKKEEIIGKGDYAYSVPFYGEKRPILVDLIGMKHSEIEEKYNYVKKEGNTLYAEAFLPAMYGGRGAYVWGVATPLLDKEGNQVGAVGTVRDITERKKAEERLERISKQNKLILNSASEGILGLDADGKQTFVNPAAARMLGYSVEELLGRHSHSTWHHTKADGSLYPENECPIYGAYHRGIESHRVRDEVFWRKDGTSFPVAYTSTPIVENGSVVGAVVTFLDITERKKAENVLKKNEDNFKRLIDRNPVAMAVADKNGKFIFFNNRFTETFGYTIEDIPSVDDWWPLAYPDMQYRQKVIVSWRAAAKKAIKNKKDTETQEWKVRCKDGSVRDIEFRMASMQDVNIVIFNDITGRKKAEETISQLAAIVEFSDDAIISMTLDGIITSWNLGAKKLYGYGKRETLNRPISMLIPPARFDEAPILLEQVRRGEGVDHYETVRKRKDGTLIDVALTISPIKHSGKISGASVIARDITERKKTEELFRYLSTTDDLTGLPNRRDFDAFLDGEWRRALRDRHEISMMMIDVDFFKKYNDTYGHLKGDACLKSVAKVLEGIARRPGDKVARYGGEEFVVILPATDKQHAVSVAEKIRTDMEDLRIPHEKSEISDYVTISIGVVSVIPEQNMSPVDLIKSADQALYKAKEEGRNRVVFNEGFLL